jgi:CRP-like cAMP-binding protein
MKVIGQEKGLELHLYAPGETLFHEGDIGHELFVIRRGSVEIRAGHSTEGSPLAKLTEGALLGEMSMLDNQPRSATVIAAEPTVTLTIPRGAFDRLLPQLPHWLLGLIQGMVGHLRRSNAMVGTTLVSNPTLSVAVFLFRVLGAKGPRTLDELKKRHLLLSRVPSAQFTAAVKSLLGRGLLVLGSQADPEVQIADMEKFKLFLDVNMCLHDGKEYPILTLSEFSVRILRALYADSLAAPHAFRNESQWEQILGAALKVSVPFALTDPLRKMGLMVVNGEGLWAAHSALLRSGVLVLDHLQVLKL